MKDIEKMSIDDKIEYWHTHETGNSLREFLGMTEQEYLEFCLPNANLILDNVAGGVMDREKQIKEIGKIICDMKNSCDGCMWDKVHCNERNYAEEIYNAGYRKQSEPISCSHEKGGEWISVDERLPKQRKLVLCIWTLENGCLNNYGFARYQGENVWHVSNEGIHKVTYWMPLPEAPKTKEGVE